MPIPETYTVPQSYQPRRPEFRPEFTSSPDSEWPHHAGPIPVSSPSASTHASPSTGPTHAPSASASSQPSKATSAATPESWSHYVAAGAFLAAGALLATGHRRLGIAAAAAGAATVLLDDQEMVATLCQQAPVYLAEVQSLVSQAEQLLRSYFPATDGSRR